MESSHSAEAKAQTTVIPAMSSLKAQTWKMKKTTQMNLKTHTMPRV